MQITKKQELSTVTIAIAGRLDTLNAPQLEEELKSVMLSTKELVLDLSKLEYVSSAGLRVFLFAQKMMKKLGHMKVVGTNPDIMNIFEVTGFKDFLDIE